jgi:hypothetical protein
MTKLDYLMEVHSSCDLEDTNLAAFIDATYLIGGHDVVEEFLASGLWPLGQQFGFRVETKESPLSKLMVLMPLVTASIGERESEAQFVARVKDAMNQLIGKYKITEHNAYQVLRHERRNHIFKFTEVLCQPQPEPIVWKHKSTNIGTVPLPRKNLRKACSL